MKRRGKTGTVAQTRERGGILMGTTSMDSVYKLHFIYIHTRRKVPSTKAKREKKKRSEKDCKVRQLLQRRIIFRLGDEIK